MVQVAYVEVERIWAENRGKDTGGILGWFAPQITTRWDLIEIPAREVGELMFIGEEGRGRWGSLTGGTYRVADTVGVEAADDFAWNDQWCLVTVTDPENQRRVILDGNSRALQLHLAVARGSISPDLRIRLAVGELNLLIVRIAKAVASLWR